MSFMTKRLFFLHFLFIFVAGSTLWSQDTSVRPYPMEERALLWKIEGNGVTTKSYLFGTVHLIEKELFYFPKKLQKTLAKSEVLTMEIAGIPNPVEAMKLAQLEEGTFFDFFSNEQKDSILIWVENNTALNQKAFEMIATKMKPFVVAQLMTEMDKNNPNAGVENKESYERELEAIAKEENLEIKGFETVAEQMSYFDAFSDEQQAEMVMSTVRRKEGEPIEELNKMMALYGEQNIDGLYQLIAEDTELMEEMNAILLTDRNKRWVPMIEEMIAEKSTFIAVGAGHLGGPEGVIRLLEAKGYTLTPVKL